MKLKPDELTEHGFVLIDKFHHSELITFLQVYINKRTVYSLFYYVWNILLFMVFLYMLFRDYDEPQYTFDDQFYPLLYGWLIAFLLIPVHEYIHILPFKSQGATQTKLSVYFRKLIVAATAHHFVTDRKETAIITLSPFVIITILLLICFFMLDPTWHMTIITTLSAHSGFCIGDFGIMSYFQFNRDKELVSYDDMNDKVTYIFGRAPESGRFS